MDWFLYDNGLRHERVNAYYRQNIKDKHATKKTKILRGNRKPHFDKNLRKQVMTRSRLKNKVNRSKSE